MKAHKIQIYFGLSRPNGTELTLDEWLGFESGVLAKSIPGFTVTESIGYWNGEKERSKIVTVIIETSSLVPTIRMVAEVYKDRFEQEAVLVTEELGIRTALI